MRLVALKRAAFMCLVFCGGCGVKGKPLPPLTPSVLGRGEPNLSKGSENVKVKKKINTHRGEPDWDDPHDFPEDQNP